MPEGIGQTLREARVGRGLELSDVERVTKLRTRYLRAMEEEEWEILPGEAYARGFLRTYARFLGLDAEGLVARYTEQPRRPPGPQPISPGPETERAVRAQAGPHAAASRGPRGQRLPAGVVGGRSIQVGSSRPLGGIGIGPALSLAVVLLAVVLLIVALTRGGDDGAAEQAAENAPPPVEPVEREAPVVEEEEPVRELVELELMPTGSVWVCLVDHRDRELIDGVTLGVDEEQGPFEADGFRITLGNGQVEMRVDGDDFEVPLAAEPLGYEVGPAGVDELAVADRPTCA